MPSEHAELLEQIKRIADTLEKIEKHLATAGTTKPKTTEPIRDPDKLWPLEG
jgi:DNA anti-recombination protein RmuC